MVPQLQYIKDRSNESRLILMPLNQGTGISRQLPLIIAFL